MIADPELTNAYRLEPDAAHFVSVDVGAHFAYYPIGGRYLNAVRSNQLDFLGPPQGYEKSLDGIHWTPLLFPVGP